ncbi:competence type IV pilus minor pilin ComGE [Aeribacillus alveayuensis]|uniref:ABC-type microcin C transport system permease subunit YejE n=1 Tax=Aeribacillus alveayuensis TaxID=279215 RepID=A0ABT9VK65_9BACI|nr:ABC-type microcin C transport system permease subunit YejE [Bacillus alveayuensis]
MWKNCKGSVLAESILSFSLWCFITMMMIPILTSIILNERNLVMKTEAYQLLHEELQHYAYEKTKVNGEVRKGKNTYVLFWSEEGEYYKLCIKWGETNENEVCGYSLP